MATMPPKLTELVLCLVTDRSLLRESDSLVDTVDAAIRGGVNMVQLRDKQAEQSELLRITVALKQVTVGRALLLVNDQIGVAIAGEADGVQLGEVSLPVRAARKICGEKMLIGRSVHSVNGAKQSEHDGADLLLLGTIFRSRSHPQGIVGRASLINEVVRAVSKPVIGIGGINSGNAHHVVAAGARGIAVISAIMGDPCPEAASRRLALSIGTEIPE